ncbi:TPA: hypothetical protein R0348_004868 [Salmonella enterica subsp. enterica serovar Hvittingfoss]|nr:hypothetical protein [Salmonella enterica subsp. enterica serovar Hvittingfoss]
MKRKEKYGTGRYLFSRQRLLLITGLALLLSAGMRSEADTVTYTYSITIKGNTCLLQSPTEAVQTGPVSGADPSQSGTFSVKWDNINKEKLQDPAKRDVRKFGIELACTGDIYMPRLTITVPNQSAIPGETDAVYTSETAGSPVMFGVRFARESSDYRGGFGSQGQVLQDLRGSSPGAVNNVELDGELPPGTTKKVILEAWPWLMPGKSVSELQGGMVVKGTVTIEVRYN